MKGKRSTRFGVRVVRELSIHCKKEGVNLGDLVSALRIENYIKHIGADEERVEQFIARCAASQDPFAIKFLFA